MGNQQMVLSTSELDAFAKSLVKCSFTLPVSNPATPLGDYRVKFSLGERFGVSLDQLFESDIWRLHDNAENRRALLQEAYKVTEANVLGRQRYLDTLRLESMDGTRRNLGFTGDSWRRVWRSHIRKGGKPRSVFFDGLCCDKEDVMLAGVLRSIYEQYGVIEATSPEEADVFWSTGVVKILGTGLKTKLCLSRPYPHEELLPPEVLESPQPHFQTWQTTSRCLAAGLLGGSKTSFTQAYLLARQKWGATHFDFQIGGGSQFVLPQDMQKFRLKLAEKDDTMRPTGSSFWVLKADGRNNGRGIYLIQNSSQLAEMVDFSRMTYIAQPLLSRPLLLGGHTFHVRTYIAISSVQPLKVWFHLTEGQLNFSPRKRSSSETLSTASFVSNLNVADDSERPKPMLLRDFWNFARERRIDTKKLQDRMMDSILKSTLATALLSDCPDQWSRMHSVHRGSACFEFFAADFLFDEDWTSYLIEIQQVPKMIDPDMVRTRAQSALLRDLVLAFGLGAAGRHRLDDQVSLQFEEAQALFSDEYGLTLCDDAVNAGLSKSLGQSDKVRRTADCLQSDDVQELWFAFIEEHAKLLRPGSSTPTYHGWSRVFPPQFAGSFSAITKNWSLVSGYERFFEDGLSWPDRLSVAWVRWLTVFLDSTAEPVGPQPVAKVQQNEAAHRDMDHHLTALWRLTASCINASRNTACGYKALARARASELEKSIVEKPRGLDKFVALLQLGQAALDAGTPEASIDYLRGATRALSKEYVQGARSELRGLEAQRLKLLVGAFAQSGHPSEKAETAEKLLQMQVYQLPHQRPNRFYDPALTPAVPIWDDRLRVFRDNHALQVLSAVFGRFHQTLVEELSNYFSSEYGKNNCSTVGSKFCEFGWEISHRHNPAPQLLARGEHTRFQLWLNDDNMPGRPEEVAHILGLEPDTVGDVIDVPRMLPQFAQALHEMSSKGHSLCECSTDLVGCRKLYPSALWAFECVAGDPLYIASGT